jgi:hypothetical protein
LERKRVKKEIPPYSLGENLYTREITAKDLIHVRKEGFCDIETTNLLFRNPTLFLNKKAQLLLGDRKVKRIRNSLFL